MKQDTTQVKQTAMVMTFTSANSSEYPTIYAKDEWQIALADSKIAKLFGDKAGQYTQEEINNKLAEVAQAGAMPVVLADSTESVTSPAENTLYLIYGSSDSSVLFDKYTWTSAEGWSKVGSVNVDMTNVVTKSEDFTTDYLLQASGTKSAKSNNNIAASDVETILKDFKGTANRGNITSPAAGSLADMLNKFHDNGNELGGGVATIPVASEGTLGGINIGYQKDDTNKNYPVQLDENHKAYVNVPWSGNENLATASSAGLMSADQFKQLKYYQTDIECRNNAEFVNKVLEAFNAQTDKTTAFIAPLKITATNIFGFGLTGDSEHRLMATFVRNSTTATAFTVHFQTSGYNFCVTYNGLNKEAPEDSSFTLYFEEYSTKAIENPVITIM